MSRMSQVSRSSASMPKVIDQKTSAGTIRLQIGGAPVRLKRGVELSIASNDRGRLQAFFSGEGPSVSANIRGSQHRNPNTHFPAQIGELVELRDAKGIVGKVLLDHLTEDRSSVEVLVH